MSDTIDLERRENLGALLGALGGAVGLAALTGCTNDRASELSGTSVDALTSSGVVFVDTVLGASPATGGRSGALARADATALGGNLVVASGCVTPGDGGGGAFFWNAAGAVDDGGLNIVPGGVAKGGPAAPCWTRTCGGPLNVKWFGAVGDGVADDTVAIQNAMDVAGNAAYTASATAETSPSASVEFPMVPVSSGGKPSPTGVYKITGSITVANYFMHIFSREGATIATDGNHPIFLFTSLKSQQVRGLKFVGGSSHLVLTPSLNGVQVVVEGCEFASSSAWAIDNPPSSVGADDLVVRDCRFVGCAAALRTGFTVATLSDCYIATAASMPSQPLVLGPSGMAPSVGQGSAVIAVYGSLRMRNVVCECAYTSQNDLTYGRWVDNLGGTVSTAGNQEAGDVDIVYCRFADGPLTPVVHWGSTIPSLLPSARIAVRDSAVVLPALGEPACGASQPPPSPCSDAGPVGPAVVAIGSGCPQRIILEGLGGPAAEANVSLVNTWQGYAIWTYLSSLPAAYLKTLKISIDASSQWQSSGGVCPVVASLLQYVNPFESSTFPTGAQTGVALTALPGQPYGTTPTNQACADFDIPGNVVGFVAMVTISAVPNVTCATYLVSMLQGAGNDTLCVSTPLFAPNTVPMYWKPLAIKSVTFLDAFRNDTSSSTRANAAGKAVGGAFRIIWDNGNAGVPAGATCISLQPLHLMSEFPSGPGVWPYVG
jgi:hypothetical protein